MAHWATTIKESVEIEVEIINRIINDWENYKRNWKGKNKKISIESLEDTIKTFGIKLDEEFSPDIYYISENKNLIQRYYFNELMGLEVYSLQTENEEIILYIELTIRLDDMEEVLSNISEYTISNIHSLEEVVLQFNDRIKYAKKFIDDCSIFEYDCDLKFENPIGTLVYCNLDTLSFKINKSYIKNVKSSREKKWRKKIKF